MIGRHRGTVIHFDDADDFGEIECKGLQPVRVDGAALRRIGARLGSTVDFAQGVLGSGVSGAVEVELIEGRTKP